MPSSTSRSSTKSQSRPPFIPGTPFLSESPAWVERSPTVVYSSHAQTGPQQPEPRYSSELRSPIPPPPANLYQGTTTALNVDPGIPFLATAGPSDAGDSEQGSVKDEEPQSGRFVGGFVTGIKKAVRNSLRRSRPPQSPPQSQPPPQTIYAQPPEFRDSGYAPSVPQGLAFPIPLTGVLSPVPDYQEPSPTLSGQTHSSRYSASPRSETLVGHSPKSTYGKDEKFTVIQPIPPPPRPQIAAAESIMSPVSADPEFGSDYAQMNPPTPPPSDTSFNTYLSRLSQIVKNINELPWVAKERVTADYYPERSRRKDEPKRHPAISWRSEAYYQHEHRPSGVPVSHHDANMSEASGSMTHLITPHRRSHPIMDLDAEFDPTPRPTPLPANPPSIPPSMPTTPAHGFVPPLPAEPPVPPSYQVPPDLSRGFDPATLPSNSMLFWGEAPQPSGPLPENPPPPATWGYASAGQTPKVNYGVFATPKSATSRRSRRSERSQNAAQTAGYAPPLAPSGRSEWEAYPHERTGYVPYEFAENYYGTQYGPGVHAARPPVAPPPISAPSSTTSLRQPP